MKVDIKRVVRIEHKRKVKYLDTTTIDTDTGIFYRTRIRTRVRVNPMTEHVGIDYVLDSYHLRERTKLQRKYRHIKRKSFNVYLGLEMYYRIQIRFNTNNNKIAICKSLDNRRQQNRKDARKYYQKHGKSGGFQRHAGYIVYPTIHPYKSEQHCLDCRRHYRRNIRLPRVRQRQKNLI